MNKNGLRKAASVSGEISEQISEKELEQINRYTRRPLSAEEVYVFSLVLCDNDIDRDGERFTVESLFALEKLFVGRTGIFDHKPEAKNQKARIFSCSVEAVEGRNNALGDEYFQLKARAYMPKTEGNLELIAAIDSGMIKEVSVGCAVEKTLCSICGEELHRCTHRKGERYGGRICCGELINPVDAYEWSFVAVPAQKEAGIVKGFKGKDRNMDEILKSIDGGVELTLNREECKKLSAYIGKLKQAAKDGVYYRDSLTAEVLRLSAAVQPDISRDTMESVAKGMSVSQLKEFKTAFEKQKKGMYAPKPQLISGKSGKQNENNGQFTI